ncbi:MAG: enoyl-CoA hydratase/isomerase family protein [Planctomycetes bacterium]|nr:enoyl-CoA hydratase/isomerase family protein [Planctomycetota bacterium]
MSQPLVVTDSTRPGVAVLTLNRPDKRNALSASLMEELCAGVEAAEGDKTKRVLILRGAGAVFCSGLDLREAADPTTAERSAHMVARMLTVIHRSPLVSIAAVHGAAAAGGAGLMSACDLVVAAEDAKIGYPETQRGFVAGLVMTFLLRQVGERAARELLLLAQMIDADRAVAIGLVNRTVPADKVFDTALMMADQVAQGAPGAVVRTKSLLRELAHSDLDEDIRAALDHHLAARGAPEAKEGFAAFLEKRAPAWTQKPRDWKRP